MRLIDADGLKERFKERYMAAVEWKNKTIFREKAEGAIAAYLECVRTLNSECTIDAVPVVRCKDCKYYAHDDFGTGEKYWCMHFVNTNTDGLLTVDEDDFCSFGEKKCGCMSNPVYWIDDDWHWDGENEYKVYICSNCGYHSTGEDISELTYCPNCHAKMNYKYDPMLNVFFII